MSTKGKLNLSQIVIVSKYFETVNDFKYAEMSCPKFQVLCEMLHFNPITVDEETRQNKSHKIIKMINKH